MYLGISNVNNIVILHSPLYYCLDSNSSGRRLHRRSAVSSHMTSKDESHGIGSDVTTQGVVVSVVVVVIGLIVLVSVVAMCGGSDTYDTVQNVTYKS